MSVESSSRPPSPPAELPATARPYRFTWDHAARRPGPETVSAIGDDFAQRPSLNLESLWSSTTHGFHAISTVLNNPHKRQAPPKPHSHLPPAVPADLPRVRRKDFDPYLRAIAPDWVRFQLSTSAAPPIPLPNPKPLHIVPNVFFSQSFSLSDPPTFNAVTTDADGDSLPLLEKFSHYADTVEQHLVLEISRRAPSFFAALTNLHDLHAESEHCLKRIASLRTLLTDLDNNSAKKGLELVRKQARAANLAAVTDAVKQVASVVEMGRVARALVSAGQWGQALAVIEELHSMSPAIPTEDVPPKIPLSSLRAYTALPEHLRALTMEIAASLSSELVSVLRDDLVQRRTDTDLRDRLRPLLQNLVRTQGVKEGLLSWREVVLGLVRQIVRSRLPKEDQGEEPKAFNRTHFRDLPHPEFISLLQNLYADLLTCIQGIQSQSNVIVAILEAETGKLKELGPSTTSTQVQDELTDLLASAAELANTHSATLIAFRHDEHASLELADFLSFFNGSWAFVVRCEVLSRRMIVGLRGVVVGQAKAFLQAFHQRRITSSAKLVEDEQWNPAEISAAMQTIVDAIVGSAVMDAPELVVKPEGKDAVVDGLPVSAHTPEETPPRHIKDAYPNGNAAAGFSAVKAPTSKHLRIEDRTYFAVSATTEVLVLLLDYLRVVVNLSMLTTDVMSRVVEFLKAFNSRTCQVVLGAGAMRSAGLKNITAKHLALASQSLSIMFELIPYVRETFRRHLSPKQAVMLIEFDKLKRDYQEHQNEIHSKLIAIMGDRLNAHIKSLQVVDWNVPKPGGAVNDYVEILVKETVTLHKVLSRYLSVPVVEYVMTQVFAAINHGLSEEYNKIELPNQEAKTRLLADAKYLHQKLSALKNVAPPSAMLVTVVSEKTIPRTGPPSPLIMPVQTPTRSNTLSSANQRLKGLLSGKSANFDKALPTPVRSSSSSLVSPPLPPLNGGDKIHREELGRTSTSSASTGFKQVELPLNGSPGPVPETAAKLPRGEIQEQRRTLSPKLPPTPHDTTPSPPEPESAAHVRPDPDPDPDTEPEVQTEYAMNRTGTEFGNAEVGPDLGSLGDGSSFVSAGAGAVVDTSESLLPADGAT